MGYERNYQQNDMILGEGQYFSMDCYKTKVNNNVLVVGTSGAGKTRSIVTPNLLQGEGSYVVSDPKGNLYEKHKHYLEARGYIVKKLDLVNLLQSTHYNFMKYIKSDKDVIKIAHMLTYELGDKSRKMPDPFWDEATCLLLQAIISYVMTYGEECDRTFATVLRMLNKIEVSSKDGIMDNPVNILFDEIDAKDPGSFALNQYKKFCMGAGRTLQSILITAFSKTSIFELPELQSIMADDEMDIQDIGKRKTAVFVCVSDTDRSFDPVANLFFTQTMNVLCEYADRECEDNRLPIPVRFILDDFATNCHIAEFPRMISSIRSRGISVMLMIQAEAQLETYYLTDANTIISNCDTYVYMGTNDLNTAERIAQRTDLPLKKILYMPIGENYIFRRGMAPIQSTNFDLDKHFGKILAAQEKKCSESIYCR